MLRGSTRWVLSIRRFLANFVKASGRSYLTMTSWVTQPLHDVTTQGWGHRAEALLITRVTRRDLTPRHTVSGV